MNARLELIAADKARAIELKQRGLTNLEIGQQLRRSKSTISLWMVEAGLAKPVADTGARNAEIERRLGEGQSGPTIARAMGITKNVIAGLRNRLQRDGAKFPTDGNHTGKRKSGAARLASADSVAQIRGGGIALEKIGAKQCRYPHGHPGDKNFSFCGAPTTGILESYCPPHRAKCWKARVA